MRIFKFLIIGIVLFLPLLTSSAKIKDAQPSQKWIKKYKHLNFESIEGLKKGIKLKGPLTSWLSLQLADRYIENENYHVAINVLQKVDDEGTWDFWKRVLLANAYLGLGQERSALKQLHRLPPEPNIKVNPSQTFYRLLYQKALQTKRKALKKSGKSTREVSARLWALFPDLDNQGKKIRDSSKITKNIPASVRTADKIARLHVLHALGFFKTIPQLITANEIFHSKLPSSEKCLALADLSHTHRKLRQWGKALEGFTKIVQEKCDGQVLARTLYWKARIELKLKKTDQALATHHYFTKKFPRHRYTDDAYYSLWKLYLGLGKNGQAKKSYNNLVHLANGDMKLKAFWEAAWPAFKKGKYKKAISYFDKILSAQPMEDESYPQALYWKARSLEKLDEAKSKGKKSKVGHTYYRRLVKEFPFSYYSVLSAHQLEISPQQLPLPNLNPEVPIEARSQELVITVNHLNANDLPYEAQKLLDYFTHHYPDMSGQMPEVMALAWIKSGDYNRALSIASDHFGYGFFGGVSRRKDPMVLALYPKAYPFEVKVSSKKTGLSPSIIQGIMREESLFQSAVLSRAGAVGVMQLMPATARIQARHLNLNNFSVEDLTNPQTNIMLGSGFFKRMIRLFNDQVPLAIMAYNAGPGNVKKWLRRNRALPLDEFVEEIPFSETRGYVKRVLRSIQVYGLILNDPQVKKPFFSMKIE